jgi:hypothetical protein
MERQKKLTTNSGAPVVDNQNIMTAGNRGPASSLFSLPRLACIVIGNSHQALFADQQDGKKGGLMIIKGPFLPMFPLMANFTPLVAE